MNLKKQLQELLDDALKFEISPLVIEKAIIPGLVKLAKPLKHSSYYVWQNHDNQLISTILKNRTNPNLEKKVIYAFPNIAIAQNHAVIIERLAAVGPETNVITEVAVTHLIFEVFGLTSDVLDSIIFVHEQGNNYQFQELKHQTIQQVLFEKIEKLKNLIDTNQSPIRLA